MFSAGPRGLDSFTKLYVTDIGSNVIKFCTAELMFHLIEFIF
jgi:hypothetical protein